MTRPELPRERVMDHILAMCPMPDNDHDWFARTRNVDQCMRPLAASLGYDGCPECLGSRVVDPGVDDSPCPTCGGTAVVELTR